MINTDKSTNRILYYRKPNTSVAFAYIYFICKCNSKLDWKQVIPTLVKKKKKKNFLQTYEQKITVHKGDKYPSSSLEFNYLINLNHWQTLVASL